MKKISTLLLIFFAAVNNLPAQLSVTAGSTPQSMVTAITAGGIAVSNISYTGAPTASGTFTCPGGCNLALSGGIIITSGSAAIAATPNTGTGQGADVGAPGDPDLNNLTTGPTQDAAVLEFDFVAVSDTAVFNYIFASDEYSDYVNSSFNDVFGFFISGPGITGLQNIALVPGTAIPIAINNVNNGFSASIPTGPCTNCTYFLDNVSNSFTTAYDGLTTVLTATAANIQPGQIYHLKLAIADVQDHIFDSGVFLEAGSFRVVGPPAVFIDGNRVAAGTDTIHVCMGSSVTLSVPAGFTYFWNTGETTQSITVSTSGNYSANILGSNFNFPILTEPLTFIVDVTPLPLPVLSFGNNTLTSSVNSTNYTYTWTLNGVTVPGANAPDLAVLQSGCYRVTVSEAGGCFETSDSLCVVPTGIVETSASNNIKLFPNPFTQSCTLTFDNPSKNNYSFRIIDLTGRELRSIENIFTDHIYIEKENLRAGIYFYDLINTTKNEMQQGKLMIN